MALPIEILQYINEEQKSSGFWSNLNNNKPIVRPTYELSHKLNKTKPTHLLKPSVLHKAAIGIFVVFGVIAFITLLQLMLNAQDLKVFATYAFLICIPIALVIVVFKRFILNKKVNYTLEFSDIYIKTNDTAYLWEEIKETYIMTKFENKTEVHYLLLLFKNQHIEKHALSGFSYTDAEVASMVDYHKNQSKT